MGSTEHVEWRSSLEGSQNIVIEVVDKKDVAGEIQLKCESRYVSGALNTKLMHYCEELKLSVQ